MSESRSAETVTIQVLLHARPQFIAPNGRWGFSIMGKDFEVQPTKYNPARSPVGAEAAARRMCKRLGFVVSYVEVEQR